MGDRRRIAIKHRKGKCCDRVLLDRRQQLSERIQHVRFPEATDTGVEDVFSLAWFAKKANPSTSVTFKWSLDYSFVWDETGVLTPGVTFDASQVVSADPANTNQNAVTFDCPDGAYQFEPAQGPAPGSLYINESGNIPANQASVGVGMAGYGIFADQAQPNLNLAFTPDPNYWIIAGTFVQGQVMAEETFTQAAPVVFPDNVYSMTATLQANNTWSVVPTPSAQAVPGPRH